MFSLKGYRPPQARFADWLPWGVPIAEGVLGQKDGTVLRSFRFRAHDLGASGPSEWLSTAARANNALQRLGSGWTLFVESRRRRARPLPAAHWPTPAGRIVDLEVRHRFANAVGLFESDYFLTLCWKLPNDKAAHVTSIFYAEDGPQAAYRSVSHDLDTFHKTVDETVGILSGVFCEFAPLNTNELATYFKSTISNHHQTMVMPEVPVSFDSWLPDCAFDEGEQPRLGDQHLSILTIREFPSTTFVGMLDGANQLGFPYRCMTRFVCMSKDDAQAEIIKLQKHWDQQAYSVGGLMKEVLMGEVPKPRNPAAALKSDETKAALAELANSTAAFGLATTTFVTSNASRQHVEDQSAAIKKLIQSRGVRVIDERHNSLEAFLGSLPGHVLANVRRPMIHTQNLAHILPISAMWCGDAVNTHLKKKSGLGHAHIYATSGSSPYFVNFNPDGSDLGNLLVVGPPGSGKSTFGAKAACDWTKYPDARVIIYDYGGSARAATLAHSSVPGYAQYFAPGDARAPMHLQPLRDIHDPSERVWAAEFVRLLLVLQGIVITTEVQEAVDAALDKVASHGHPAALMIGHYARILGTFDKRLRAALRPYTRHGIYGHIFDAAVLSESEARYAPWRMYEMSALMALGEAAVIPALKYLDHCDRATYTGAPVLKLYDECWRFMDHPTFADNLREDQKTLRKKNVFMGFLTQELADAASKPKLLATILNAVQLIIFGADPNALAPEAAKIYGAFGLSPHEISLIATLQPKREYYYRSGKRRRVFQLNLGPAALAIAGASSVQDHRDMDAIVEKYPPEEYAAQLFERRGVAWAARAARPARVESAPAQGDLADVDASAASAATMPPATAGQQVQP